MLEVAFDSRPLSIHPSAKFIETQRFSMIVYLNGQFVPEAAATVSVFDRGFLYGDGLFETVAVHNGKPFRWKQHLERLRKGAAFIGIVPPLNDAGFTEVAQKLSLRNQVREGILRIALSRGVGHRGYSPKGADSPTLVVSTHPAPAKPANGLLQWNIVTSPYRVAAGDSLLLIKSANKLLNILARAEAEARGADEALLVNTDGHLSEAAGSNLFWIDGNTLCTPPLDAGALEGVSRGLVLEICRGLKIPVEFRKSAPSVLASADGVLLSNSGLGLVEVVSVDGKPVSTSPLVERLAESYGLQILAEC